MKFLDSFVDPGNTIFPLVSQSVPKMSQILIILDIHQIYKIKDNSASLKIFRLALIFTLLRDGSLLCERAMELTLSSII